MFAMNLKKSVFAFAALLLSGSVASAAMAIVQTPLNVRAGKGTGYRVVGTMPPGAAVNAVDCGGGWCFIPQYGGYASAGYLAFRAAGGPPPGVAIGAAAIAAGALVAGYPYYWGGYYGPAYYYGRPWYGPRRWYGPGRYPYYRGRYYGPNRYYRGGRYYGPRRVYRGGVYRGAAYRGGYRGGAVYRGGVARGGYRGGVARGGFRGRR